MGKKSFMIGEKTVFPPSKPLNLNWRVLVPFGVIIIFNIIIIRTSLTSSRNLYIILRDSPPDHGGSITFLYPGMVYGLSFLLLVISLIFKNVLRNKVQILRILVQVIGFLLLFQVVFLLFLEFRFSISHTSLSASDLEYLSTIIMNIAFFGFEMLLFWFLRRKKPIEE